MTQRALEAQIRAVTGQVFQTARAVPIGGGCINQAQRLEGVDGRRYFVKFNRAEHADMFAAEAEGLEALAQAGGVRVPEVIGTAEVGGQVVLILEYLDLGGRPDPERLGEGLARTHAHRAEAFGWHRDNTIGSTPQPNPWTADWTAFWRDHRLNHQLDLAAGGGLDARTVERGRRLAEWLAAFFADATPVPSILHGDLWGGNCAGTPSSEPVLFDPAVYYGDREADLAMTELFGGFSGRFYAAYDGVWPRGSAYPVRRTLYNLYHVLNHYNLFGGGYGAQAGRMIDQLLSEAG